jgi:hypothetical protein
MGMCCANKTITPGCGLIGGLVGKGMSLLGGTWHLGRSLRYTSGKGTCHMSASRTQEPAVGSRHREVAFILYHRRGSTQSAWVESAESQGHIPGQSSKTHHHAEQRAVGRASRLAARQAASALYASPI